MHFSQFLLVRLYIQLHWDDMLDNLCIIYIQVIISPCKYVFMLFEQFNGCRSLSGSGSKSQVDILRILLRTKNNPFILHGGAICFASCHSFELFMQIIKIFHSHHGWCNDIRVTCVIPRYFFVHFLIMISLINNHIFERLLKIKKMKDMLILLRHFPISYLVSLVKAWK